MVCCFWGHRDMTHGVEDLLEKEVEMQIAKGVDCFMVGNQGSFDAMVLSVLRKLSGRYRSIEYKVVLAYVPKYGEMRYQYWETILPEGIESVHPKYAITYRNRWMLDQADVVIAYVAHQWGGAAKYTAVARRKGVEVVNIFEKER